MNHLSKYMLFIIGATFLISLNSIETSFAQNEKNASALSNAMTTCRIGARINNGGHINEGKKIGLEFDAQVADVIAQIEGVHAWYVDRKKAHLQWRTISPSRSEFLEALDECEKVDHFLIKKAAVLEKAKFLDLWAIIRLPSYVLGDPAASPSNLKNSPINSRSSKETLESPKLKDGSTSDSSGPANAQSLKP